MRLIGLSAVAVLIISFVVITLIATFSYSERSSCQPDFKTKTIYLDSPDNPAFWTIKTAHGEWGCKKKKRKGKV